VFLAAAGAHVVVTALGGHGFGPVILVALGVTILGAAVVHRWWTGRPEARTLAPQAPDVDALWLVRATVDDRPGRLAVLAGALAALNCDIRALQVHMSTDGPVDEFLVHIPSPVTVDQLVRAIRNAGSDVVHVVVAEIHDLTDPVSRALTHAAHLVARPGDLPTALARMLSASVEKLDRARPGTLADDSMYLADPAGGVLAIHRPAMPFTPTEYARAQALTGVVRSRQPS
jgi:Flp pilus assembly protein TadB